MACRPHACSASARSQIAATNSSDDATISKLSSDNPAEEHADPQRSNERYTFATRTLITRIRQQQGRHPLVHTENIAYGFRRNLLALRPIAVTLLSLLLGADVAALALGRDPQLVGAAITIHVVILIVWLTAIGPGWVMRQANSYAERLFDTLEDPRLIHTSTE